ncbi:hypothetical protein LP419_01735 [Massilia sp. H-1]|nr:hypothetical protein LP419_01735 [Massilia sp. H-1]
MSAQQLAALAGVVAATNAVTPDGSGPHRAAAGGAGAGPPQPGSGQGPAPPARSAQSAE